MVLLTMTPSMVEGLNRIQSGTTATDAITIEEGEPDLSAPDVAKPISHGQVLQLWTALRGRPDADAHADARADAPTLEALLVGARVYVPPPPPKPEPSDEYKALMACLRRDEEARAYERMVNPPDAYAASSFAQVNSPARAADTGDDGVTLSDVNRQVMLIFNFVLTMAGVAYALWVLARWWPTPSRLFLAMGGSILTGVAEYGLYAGYVWHLSEAAKKDKAPAEVREVVQTWVVGPEAGTGAGDGEELPEESTETKEDDSKAGHEETLISNGAGASGRDQAQARRRKKEATS